MTETGSGVVYDGRPLHDVEVRIVDDEVQLRAPMLLRCYRDGHDPRTPDGWFPTGDTGRWLPDGRLHVEGRRGDVIVTGGEKVWPELVEAVLARHPDIDDVAINGTPDPEWGAVVTAHIVTSRDDFFIEELRDYARAELPGWALPRRLVRRPVIPRTALGKVQRHQLNDAAS
jgi:O-succinylbenzoic acid--CoA ligase